MKVRLGLHKGGKGKRRQKGQRRKTLYQARFAQLTRKEWEPLEFTTMGEGKNSFSPRNGQLERKFLLTKLVICDVKEA